ncbi:hypothetical protein D6L40_13125 [Vibrio alginolyticus]|nr:hypothetical protein AL541_17480 [Vibrio alginolyticus]EGQ8472027.1 hypothetical protein [Vibrio alginolyticus]EGQ8986003.1 hypothetical protein [Vibrio alginolyticus]EGR0306338.1 hypothetical protein [Vibrio alginolyticus]EGR1572414.1 hypothetical protein [Vibrio alginolyticus]
MNNSDKETLVLPKISQRQRNNTKEIVRKLETVNAGGKAKTSNLVPPELT